MRRGRALLASAVLGALALTACSSEADTASDNLSKDADSFKVERHIVFYNGITGQYLLEIQGLCSLGNDDKSGELTVTCKTGKDEFKKHFLGLSDNVTYFAEQTEPVREDPYHYKILFRPEEIVPDIDTQTSGGN
jgi:hypothetical protein